VSASPSTPALRTPDTASALAPATAAAHGHPPGSPFERARPRHAALVGILALSAVLDTRNLAQNAYANNFYSAAVKSMLISLHNFLFVSADPGGLVTIDKPPLALWVQTASARLFGFSPLSLLLPEAIVSTIAVAVLYRVISRRLGAPAGLISALALAVFPSFVAVSRDNGVDPLLILLMILACGAALNAIESGRWRSLLGCAALVGLAFNTKTLAAYLILPGIALAYVLCAPGALPRRAVRLLVAGVVTALVSFAWIALVELTPASQRPFVGSSTNNTELGLTFDYNGIGRVGGQVGGPGQIPTEEGAGLRIPPLPAGHPHAPAPPPTLPPATALVQPTAVVQQATQSAPLEHPMSGYLPDGRLPEARSFGAPAGPLRLFKAALAGQGAWLLPFALIGMLALALVTLGERPRRNPRLATLVVFGGWLLAEVLILSFSKGIVHPYYASAIAPGAAAMVGGGAVAFVSLARQRRRGLVLLPLAVGASVAAQLAILHEQHYMRWFAPVLIGVAVIGVAAMAARRLAGVAMAVALGTLLIAPTVYATTTWLAPVEGTFPAAGPHEAIGVGRYDTDPADVGVDRALARYVSSHRPATRWAVLTDAASTAAPLILLGLRAGALGGYSGSDPVLDGRGLARLVAEREARYVVLGGAYASRGGNLATRAVLRSCRLVPPRVWHGPPPQTVFTLALFDCAGRERQLSLDAGATAVARIHASKPRRTRV
jgi:4-amino-4-deoxy-L-arabinose transferase-like glycosyltransferase